jgi:hypothetical protein
MAADVSSFVYFAPVLVFIAVFGIMVAFLHKTKLLWDNLAFNIFVSFVIATIFITASSAGEVLLNAIPWFVVLLVTLVLMMAMIQFMGKGAEGMIGKGFAWVFIILLIIIFLISGIKVFSNSLAPYLPGATYSDVSTGDPQIVNFFAWLYSPKVRGFFMIIIAAVLVTWFMIKGGLTGSKK